MVTMTANNEKSRQAHGCMDWLYPLPLAPAEQQERRIGCEVGHICENNMKL